MKPYADAGLVGLGKVSGHKGETLTSLVKATNFRRTHEFLIQAYEAIYRYFLSLYTTQLCEDEMSDTDYRSDISTLISQLASQFSSSVNSTDLDVFRDTAANILNSSAMKLKYKDFKTFMESLSKKHDTVKFWYQFISVDCFAYLALFIAQRYRNWELRVGSIKLLAAVFTAFDHPTYQVVIPQHIQDLVRLPDSVIQYLKAGAFSVRLSPSEWHGVALDECHEMRINKDAKLAVIRPNPQKMEFLSNYLSFRASCVRNFQKEIFPEREKPENTHSHMATSRDKKGEANVNHMIEAIIKNDMTIHTDLWNIFEGKQASPEQAHDLLNFRNIGQETYESFISTRYLRVPSTSAPKRKKKLSTFTITATHKKKVKLIDQERKICQRYLKRQLAWIAEQGIDNVDTDSLFGPISQVPRALVDSKGLPQKASKACTTGFYEKRYNKLPVILNSFPPQWVPHSVILEGMFMIQTTPLPTVENMKDYVLLVINQFLKPHIMAGVQEVHVVFDTPGSMNETPKEVEQKRRDMNTQTQIVEHECRYINNSTSVPSNWRSFLACRKCKKVLTEYLAREILNVVPSLLSAEQAVFCNVGIEAYCTTQSKEILPCPSLWTNADEGDLRVWLHCTHSAGTNKLIFSRDTDVYHIGLTMLKLSPANHIIVQLSKSYKNGGKFIDLNAFVEALSNDPDLNSIASSHRPQVIQSIYVSTGCDYISFFSGVGKISFLSSFFQYAGFIAGGEEPLGSIGMIDMDIDSHALLSFLRLVGCAYFKKHTSAFEHPTPSALYKSIDIRNPLKHHEEWLQAIRRTVWLRADKESHNLPSTDALALHWKRSLWVLGMWNKATQNDIELPALTSHGWKREKGELEVQWDSPDNLLKSKERVEYVLSGCKCKTGCRNKRCKCLKQERWCGPGCKCVSCLNTPSTHLVEQDDMYDLEVSEQGQSEDEYIETDCDDEDEETDEIMELMFGPQSDDDDM